MRCKSQQDEPHHIANHQHTRSPCMTAAHAAPASEAELPPLTEGPYRKRIGLISIVACLGGMLFGYDTGVSNGAEGPMAKEIGMSLLQLGIVFSPGVEILVAGRIILGLAVGGASTVGPVYLAELAPYEIRGSITGRNELAI